MSGVGNVPEMWSCQAKLSSSASDHSIPTTVQRLKRPHSFEQRMMLPAVAKGLAITMRHFFKNVAGGEDNGSVAVRGPGGAGNNAQLLSAQIYDPVMDAWTAISRRSTFWGSMG